MKTGFIYEEPVPEDFVFGAERSLAAKFKGDILQPDGDWRPYLFDGIYSHQAPSYETNSCVSHGTANALELLRRKQFQYDQDLSDRFIAKTSNTDPARGNTPKNVAEAIRKYFTVFEQEWGTKDALTVDEFYKDIPQNLKTLAAGRGAEWEIGYELVTNTKLRMREALQYSPLGLSVPAWFEKDGEYYRPKNQLDTHWVCCIYMDEKDRLYILDSYEPYIKVMRADFIPQSVMKYHLKRQVVDQGFFTRFLTWLHKLVFLDSKEPIPVPEPPKVLPKPNYINAFAKAIEIHEGYYEGSRSFRNNNPANAKYVAQPDAVGQDAQGFAIFPTYQVGFDYLCRVLRNACEGKSKVYSPEMDLYEFFAKYAPREDNNDPIHYANTVANFMGVKATTQLKNLL